MHNLFYLCGTHLYPSFAATKHNHMAVTIAIVYRKDKTNSQGKAPVCIRITKDRKKSFISTDLKIEAKYWDEKTQKVKPSHPNSVQANNHIYDLYNKYQGELLNEQTANRSSSARSLREKVIADKRVLFMEVAQSLLDKYKSNKEIGTHDKCKSIVTKVIRFAKTDLLTLQEIDLPFLSRFEAHLRNVLGNRTNTVHKDMKFIRRVFNAAYRQGLIDHSLNPFLRYEIKTEKTHREYLTEQELKAFEELQLAPGSSLDLHRDMFVFACYGGGIRISDLLMLRWSAFSDTHIQFTTRKTTTQHSIKLVNKPLEIINKYKQPSIDGEGFIFPMLPQDLDLDDYIQVDRRITISTAMVNKNLKQLAKQAGINKNLHFHCARHSFATLALAKGIGIEYVQKFLGHSNIRETMIYAKLVSRELDAAMEKFNA